MTLSARLGRILFTLGAIVLGALLLVQWVGSPLLTSYANRKLGQLQGYRGQVGSIQLELWRGAIVAHDLTLLDRAHEGEAPLLKVKRASVSLAPLALLRGKIGGRGSVRDVQIAVVQDPKLEKNADVANKAKDTKTGLVDVHAWQSSLQQGFPLEITRFEITGLKVILYERGSRLAPQTLLEDFHLVATDFRTTPATAGDLPAKLTVQSKFSGGGTLVVDATADTGAIQPRFKATMEVKDLALVPLHDLLLAAADVDVSRGTFELFVEVNADDGHYNGYLKPFFHDLEFKAVPDPDQNFVQRAAIEVASAVTDLLKNKENMVATKAPFKGDFSDAKVDIWTTIENLLRNAFVQSLREGFEGQKRS